MRGNSLSTSNASLRPTPVYQSAEQELISLGKDILTKKKTEDKYNLEGNWQEALHLHEQVTQKKPISDFQKSNLEEVEKDVKESLSELKAIVSLMDEITLDNQKRLEIWALKADYEDALMRGRRDEIALKLTTENLSRKTHSLLLLLDPSRELSSQRKPIDLQGVLETSSNKKEIFEFTEKESSIQSKLQKEIQTSAEWADEEIHVLNTLGNVVSFIDQVDFAREYSQEIEDSDFDESLKLDEFVAEKLIQKEKLEEDILLSLEILTKKDQ